MINDKEYLKVLQKVDELLELGQYSDIAKGQVRLFLYGLTTNTERLKYLNSLLWDRHGKRTKLWGNVAKSVEEFLRDSEDLGD